MPTPLRVLIVEDSLPDAALIVRELKAAGFAPERHVAASKDEYLTALDTAFDIILADYNLPDLNALEALRLRDERHLTTPLIVVTGHLDDESAAECIRRGATDYLLKDRLKRLGSAVMRALEERRQIEQHEIEARHIRQLEKEAEVALLEANATLEQRVADRTRELYEANARLRHEIAERQKADAELRHAQKMETQQNAALMRTVVALQESEARFRDFSELASDWFWEQDADLRFTAISSNAPMADSDSDTAVGLQRWNIASYPHPPEFWEDHKKVLAAHQSFRDFRFDRIGKSGQVRHWSISGMPVHDQTGAFTGYRGIGRDITAQVESERELRRAKDHAEAAEALLQDAMDSMAAGVVICDADKRQILCNEAYRKVHDYETGSPWTPGHTSEEIRRRVLANGMYPDTIGRDPEWIEEWLQQGLEVPSSFERSGSDGTWRLINTKRMQNGGHTVVLVDITALKQAQSALRDSEARLERAQEIAKIGSWELDIASGALTWSKQLRRMDGFPPDFKPTRANAPSRIHAADLQLQLDWIADLAAGRKRDPVDIRITGPDGKERVHLTEGRPVVDADGIIRRIVGTSQDVTEHRLIERTLAQSQKMDAIGQLTGGMAHDFNNILGVIIGNLDLLKPLVGADALASELCAEARDGAVRCADLIRRLLAFARRQSLRPAQNDVNALVGDLSRLLGRTLGEHVTLTLDLDAALWPVKVDSSQLEAALINLAANARDAMPKGGQLTIASRNATLDTGYAAQHPDVSAGDYAVIEVSDTGTGIPPEIVGRIFEPFFTTKETGHGTGLGLSMAFGFVKQSGGHLTVYSEPGLGTTFRIYLPRSGGGETATADRPDPGAVVGGHETILVVEDNPQLRRTAERQLTELGYTVRESDSAAPALAILSGGEKVDLLFTDIVMPGTMDGLELANQASRLRPGLRVLLTSGFPGGHGADQRLADSPIRLLDKPYSLGELAQAVRRVLDGGDNRTQCNDRGAEARPAEETEQS